MGEPLLRKLYQDGVRDLIVRPASGGDYVPATKTLRVRLPDGRQTGAIAQTDINGPVLSMLITQDGKGLVWCETAGRSVNARTPELVRSRPQAVEDVPLAGGLFVLMLANTSTELWITGDGFESEKKLSVTLSTSFDFRKIGMAGNVDGQWMVVLSDNNLNTEESITIQVFMGDSTGQTSSQTLSLGTTILAGIGVMGYGDFQVYTYDAGFTTDTVKLYSATPSGITEVATSTAAYFNGFFFFSPNADLVTTFFVGNSYNLNSAVWDYNYGYFLQFGGTDRVCLTPSTRVDLLNAPLSNIKTRTLKAASFTMWTTYFPLAAST